MGDRRGASGRDRSASVSWMTWLHTIVSSLSRKFHTAGPYSRRKNSRTRPACGWEGGNAIEADLRGRDRGSESGLHGVCRAGGGKRLPPAILHCELERWSILPSGPEHQFGRSGGRDGNRRRDRPGCLAELSVLCIQGTKLRALVDRMRPHHARSGLGGPGSGSGPVPREIRDSSLAGGIRFRGRAAARRHRASRGIGGCRSAHGL